MKHTLAKYFVVLTLGLAGAFLVPANGQADYDPWGGWGWGGATYSAGYYPGYSPSYWGGYYGGPYVGGYYTGYFPSYGVGYYGSGCCGGCGTSCCSSGCSSCGVGCGSCGTGCGTCSAGLACADGCGCGCPLAGAARVVLAVAGQESRPVPGAAARIDRDLRPKNRPLIRTIISSPDRHRRTTISRRPVVVGKRRGPPG